MRARYKEWRKKRIDDVLNFKLATRLEFSMMRIFFIGASVLIYIVRFFPLFQPVFAENLP